MLSMKYYDNYFKIHGNTWFYIVLRLLKYNIILLYSSKELSFTVEGNFYHVLIHDDFNITEIGCILLTFFL